MVNVILTTDIAPFLVHEDSPILAALARLEETRLRVVVVVDGDGLLCGTLSDGDFRRWLVAHESPRLDARCSEAANRRCISVVEGTAVQKIESLMTDGFDLIPVVDHRGRVTSVAIRRTRVFEIAGRRISASDRTFVIAEIGINHNGSLEMGRRLVDAAAAAGADCAKFQMRDMASLYRESGDSSGSEDLGAEYTLDLLAESALSTADLLGLLDYTESMGLAPLCTPWDLQSAEILLDFGVPGFKVASADLTNHPLLEYLARTERPLIVSTGMSTEDEIVEAVDVLQSAASAFALLQCNSSYPAAFKDLNLRYMDRLAELGNCLVGYSGHERGHHITLAAVARGARIIEKHITLDRNARGNDHVVSLEPSEFKLMVQAIRDVEDALGSDRSRALTQGEQLNRLSLSKSLVASRPLIAGECISSADISVRSPGRGIQPNRQKELIGRILDRPIGKGDFFYESDVQGAVVRARDYAVPRPWGIPVRFHDWQELAAQSNPDFLEFHLSYRDMEANLKEIFPERLDYSLVVHSPDLFRDDLVLDLASRDDDIRDRSILELQRVVDLTQGLAPGFSGSMKPIVVVSMGGSSKNEALPRSLRPLLYERVASAIAVLRTDGIEVVAQTLPPFPWYLGGQRYCNLFVDPDETAEFSLHTGIRLCLDVAHTKLACNHSGRSFTSAIEVLAPRASHLHLVDAAGVDGEGFQIGEGEIDWAALCSQLRRLAPGVSFIPEIWQGHVGGGRGFWVAMERLEREMATEVESQSAPS